MDKDIILFDLDGTLTDSAPGVTKAYSLALESVGIHEKPENLKKVLGPPLDYSLTRFFGVPAEKLDTALDVYRSHYIMDGALYENSVYPGVEQLLRDLHRAGRRLVVASSKRQDLVEAVIRHFRLDPYFDLMAGSDWEVGRSTKEEVLRYVVDSLPIPDLGRAVMVGDRMYDVEGASKLGIPAVGVLWGYGNRQELISAGASEVVETPRELYELLCRPAP